MSQRVSLQWDDLKRQSVGVSESEWSDIGTNRQSCVRVSKRTNVEEMDSKLFRDSESWHGMAWMRLPGGVGRCVIVHG